MAIDYTSMIKTFAEEIKESINSNFKSYTETIENKMVNVEKINEIALHKDKQILQNTQQEINEVDVQKEERKQNKQIQSTNDLIKNIFTLPNIKNELLGISIRIKEKQENIVIHSSCLKYGKHIKDGIKVMTSWVLDMSKKIMLLPISTIEKVIGYSLKITGTVLSNIKLYGNKISNILLNIPLQVITASVKTIGFILNYSIMTPLKWFWNIGTAALSFVWKGVKTIFGVGWSVIKGAADILGSGALVFGKWLTRLFINTITNPLSWVFMVPAFLIILDPILDGLTKFISSSLNIFVKSITKTYDIISIIKTYAWNGVESGLNWINENIVNTNIFDIGGFLDKIGAFTKNILNEIIGKDNIETIKNIVSKSYNWIKSTGGIVIDKTKSILTSIVDFSRTVGDKGVVNYLLSVLYDTQFFTQIAGEWVGNAIKRQFIDRLKEIQKPEKISQQIFGQIIETETALSQELIAQQYTILDTEKLNQQQIEENMRSRFRNVFKNMSDQEFNSSILAGITKGREIKAGTRIPISVDALNLYKDRLTQLEVMKTAVNSGIIDFTTAEMSNIENTLNSDRKKFNETISSMKYWSKYNNQSTRTLTKSSLNEFTNKITSDIKRSKEIAMFTPEMRHDTMTKIIESYSSYIGSVAHVISPSTFASRAGITDKKEWESITQLPYSSNTQYETQSVPRLADGGMINPADNIVAQLNDESAKFVKENLKNIDVDLDAIKKRKENRQLKKNIINITPNKVQSESCELYTMKQLSKSLLAI